MTKDQAKDIVAKQHGYDIIQNSGGWTRWHALIDKYNPHTIGEVIDQVMDLYADDQVNELMLSPEMTELKRKAALYDKIDAAVAKYYPVGDNDEAELNGDLGAIGEKVCVILGYF
ncbi:hypothetical protein [Flavobacterium psychrotrophum]|uniref:hypothetical protein n=1 Tax=Flavobacterium psychrotrophum TaxID=2294119 RepID=UPI000E30EA9A|nr:hypothetical protein [Flavobacterium psychrotrophum]